MARFDNRVRRWSPTRWRATGPGGLPREEVAYELALTLADLGLRAGNGAPALSPPRLEPHAIADQLAVLGRELLAAPEAAAYAEDAAAALERASELI